MTNLQNSLEILLVTAPGLEDLLRAEAIEKGFKKPQTITGGVVIKGDWATAWRANLDIRGASKVLVRIGGFKARNFSQLEHNLHGFPWDEILRASVPVRIDASCKKSRIYHTGAVIERMENALKNSMRVKISPEAEVVIKARIENDFCTISIDTSGEMLHKRGHKEAVSKAPMRENLAALILRQCGYNGKEPVLDPMCGSGTFVIEAAEIAASLYPGRSRHFAFEHLKTFDEVKWQELRNRTNNKITNLKFYGSDQDPGAIRMSTANAERAGVSGMAKFKQLSVNEIMPPDGPSGLVIVNPPYGERIGDTKELGELYQTLGQRLKGKFSGWRVGIVTSSQALAKKTGLKFAYESETIHHGGLRVKVYSTDSLP